MSPVAVSVAALALMASSVSAAPRWLRRASAVAVCAAQAADIASTIGRREVNPFLSGQTQQPRWGTIVPLKAGVCAASLIWTERMNLKSAVPLNLGIAGATGAVAVRNWRIKK